MGVGQEDSKYRTHLLFTSVVALESVDRQLREVYSDLLLDHFLCCSVGRRVTTPNSNIQ